MEYNFREIEKKWHQKWVENKTYKVTEDENKKKFYVLNMFPYPSGAGLHVGHPLGYIASDIYARYKRLNGFNVLNPMGYDAYGLPAEQYAIQTGQHPEVTTVANINRYREQLDKIGFCFDWDREVRTCDPKYYHWTQWAFQKMFNSFFCNSCQKAQPIEKLIKRFEEKGSADLNVAQNEQIDFTAEEWNSFDDMKKQQILMNYRIAYLGETMVNWCPGLGTVLANDEVVNGVSERGGYPVIQKKMQQWCLRTSAYSQRLLDGLETIQWSDSIKETQKNWIGRSEGTEVVFSVKDSDVKFTIFTTRADTMFGVTFMVLAPESEYVQQVTTAEQKEEVEKYLDYVKKQQILMNYRIAYLGETMVNWCPGLGTVLANDEVVNGVSERGGYPVIQKKMQQWCLRTSAYSQRLLDGLNTIDWSDSIKETQKNWIGRSEGTEVEFSVKDSDVKFTIFTTRADTMFGVTFMVLAPESEYVQQVTTAEQKEEVEKYLDYVKKRTELDRMANHSVTGVFSGSYAINPFTGEAIPVWISEYVLAGYGTGAIMAVPAHDSRDYAFAKHFNLPIIPLIEGADVSEESFDAKEGIVTNSPVAGKSSMDGFSLNGLTVKEAIAATKKFVTEKGIGRVKVNYRLRDAIFSRQRYWGEPFPVYYKDGMPQMVPEECLPLELPEIETYKPTETGEPPLGRAKKWAWDAEKKEVVDKSLVDNKTVFPLELNTMPGFAGSSAYYLRYMDPHNDQALVSKEADEYWQNVDLYVGGCEHATGHLIYSRFWNKFLFDLGVSCKEEPFQKLVNQGMIQGRSNFVYRINSDDHDKAPVFVSLNLKKDYDVTPIHVDVNIVSNDVLDIEAFKAWRPEYQNAEFILEDGKYICGWAIEKMSKSMFNVVNPDMIVEKYGADTLRLYEMFLGPVEASKPWDTNGIDGCHRFLKKFWGLFYENRTDNFLPSADEAAKPESLKSVHKLIKKVSEDIEKFSYNTSISAFMIAVNELGQQKCHNKELLTDLVILIAPFAPHIAEELWAALGEQGSVCDAAWPKYDEQYLKENDMQLTISFNGKARFQMTFPVDANNEEIQKQVLADEKSQKYLEGFNVLKVIVVPKKIVNVVLKK